MRFCQTGAVAAHRWDLDLQCLLAFLVLCFIVGMCMHVCICMCVCVVALGACNVSL